MFLALKLILMVNVGEQYMDPMDYLQAGWWQLKYFWNCHPENWGR